MTANAHRQRAITLIGEEVQKILIPTPSAMPGPVNEKQWGGVRFGDTPLIDYLKHDPHGRSGCRPDTSLDQ